MTPPLTTSLSGGLSTVNEENVPSDAKSSSSPPKSTSATASFSASTGTATPPSSPVPDPKPDADVVITYEDALDKGRKRVKETFAKSKIGIEEKEKIFPRFHKSELTIGSVLGKGGFGTVREIVGITVRKTDQRNSFSFRSWANITQTKGGAGNGEEDQADEAEEDIYVPDFDPEFDESAFQTKKFMEDFVVGRGSAGRYAIKVISPEVKAKPKKFIRAAMDMAIETHFLSVLDHPNIIKMRGVGEGDMFDSGYFIVMDRLYSSLDSEIDGWKDEVEKSQSCMAMLLGKTKSRKRKHFKKRLSIAKDIAGAMEHLHKLSIIYRDIKPENLGFDVKGKIKLFDFGLAKELHESERFSSGTYKLTGNTGSIRYMAPEVANKQFYNLSADVYSFGIMLWEIMQMEVPFKSFDSDMIRNMVVKFGNRPEVDTTWPTNLQNVMKRSWQINLRKRPSFTEIVADLEGEIDKMDD